MIVATWVVFLLTYLGVAIGRLPRSRLDRAGIALLGAALMIGLGVVSLPEAYAAIDWNTIVLLLGTMIIAAHLDASGIFALLADKAARGLRGPLTLLAVVLLVSATASAFLVNDTVCLMLAPVVVNLTRRLQRNPLPYLLGLATAANIGAAATITGNPQNMIIGSASGIRYLDFAAALAPVALVGLILAFALIGLLHRAEFRMPWVPPLAAMPRRRPARLTLVTLAVTLATILGFFLLDPVAKPAILAAAILFLAGGLRPRRVYAAVDWSLLLMFCGLFVVSTAIAKVALTPGVLSRVDSLPLQNVPVLTMLAAVLSNLVSNVPAVLILKPFIAHMAHPNPAWLCLAMASTLAGNFTIVGSVANMIVVEKAARAGVEIGFADYFRLGAPLTVLSLVAGMLILMGSV
jgi:Na+/H+ antiporter NhaD/arsenite permease-like protein